MMQKQEIAKRLSGYWKMEAGNIFLITALMLWSSGGALSWGSWIAIVPMAGLLAVGAAYWREKLLQLTVADHDIVPMLRRIAGARKPLLILAIAAQCAAATLWIAPGLSHGLSDRICATVAAALALLEYVNYYHRQLQHFDHSADLKRLLAGRGFRRSQLAQDLRQHGLW